MRHFILALCCLTPVLTLSTVRRAAIETPEPTVTRADLQKTAACVGWFCVPDGTSEEPTTVTPSTAEPKNVEPTSVKPTTVEPKTTHDGECTGWFCMPLDDVITEDPIKDPIN